jgi:hypothetical protein
MATTAMAVGWSRVEEGQGAVGPAICTAGGPAAEMACGVDPARFILEGSHVLANWATDIGGTVGGGCSDKAGKAEDVLGSGGAITSAWGTRQR